MDLFVHTDQRHAATVLHLAGSLTAGTAAVLETALVELFAARATKIVIDLSGVVRCDSAGVALLSGAAELAAERGGEVRLAAPAATICAWLRVGEVTARTATFTTIDGAVRADLLDLIATPDREPRSWAVSAAHALATRRASIRHQRSCAQANRPRWRRPSR